MKEFMWPEIGLESLFLKSANDKDFDEELQSFQESVYQADFYLAKLKKQEFLQILFMRHY